MDIKVNLDISPEQIQKQITEAITKSAIGEQLNKAVSEEIRKLNGHDYQYQKMLGNIISSEIERVCREIVREQYKELIEDVVKKHMTEEFTQSLLDKMWQAWANKY